MKNSMQRDLMYSEIVSCAPQYSKWNPSDLYLTNLCEIQPLALLAAKTVQHLRSTRPRAVWLLLTECHDPKISAFSLTGGFEIPGLKVLWDYISEGFCDDGSWQVLLSSGWRNSAECLYRRELQRIASTKHEYGKLILIRSSLIVF